MNKKEQIQIEKAKRKLEESCEILGWDNDEFLHLLQTRNFLRACKRLDDLNEFDFEHAMKLIAQSDRLHPYLERTLKLVRVYKEEVNDGNLGDLDGNKNGYVDTMFIIEIEHKIGNLIHPGTYPSS